MRTLFYIPTGKTIVVEPRSDRMESCFISFLRSKPDTQNLFFIYFNSDKLLFCNHTPDMFSRMVSGNHTFGHEGYYKIFYRYEFEEIDI